MKDKKSQNSARSLTFSDGSHQWSKRVWQCGSPALTHTAEREVPGPHDSCYTRKKREAGDTFKKFPTWNSVFHYFISVLFFLVFSSTSFWICRLSREKKRSLCRMLTLINRLRRCAADTDRCTGADEKSPPGEKKTKQKTAFICKGTVTVSFVLSHSV